MHPHILALYYFSNLTPHSVHLTKYFSASFTSIVTPPRNLPCTLHPAECQPILHISSSFVYDFIVTFPRVLQLVVFVSWRDCGLIEHRDLDLLLLNFQTLTYYKKYVFFKKKKISWMSVLCGFLFFSSPLPLSIYPLPWHPCLALHIYFCISKCLFLFLSLSLSLSYTCRHMHMDTYTIICRNFFWASCLMEIGGQVEKKWGWDGAEEDL